ncbi:MAG: hypothetical protein KBT34_05425 [Prevotella sp.]|nr:hypothetical protein [Candidatus Prevotella equi]
MANGRKVSAVDIKRLWYTDPMDNANDVALTYSALKEAIAKATEIENVHQDTWQIEEGEPSQDFYKNQLTNSTYRKGSKTMGDVTFAFTIGRYDFTTKAALMGGTVSEDGKSWARQRGVTDVNKMLIALTEDDVYCVIPVAAISAREANTDGAIGIAVQGTMMEPSSKNVDPEYWFDGQE